MSIDTPTRSDPLRRRLRRLTRAEQIEEARAFVRQFHRESELPQADARVREAAVVRSLRRTGHYEHTPDELAFGARVAWRNHANCIGRLHWKALDVFDCRAVAAPDAIAARVAEHMRGAWNGGRIRSAISIFAPVMGERLPAYVESRQVAQYAGYLQPGGRVLGDPLNVEVTRTLLALGWSPPTPRSAFDLLPLLVRDAAGGRHFYALPDDALPEVALVHPSSPGFDALELRWYAVPCVCDMILTIGGIDYPCAPFNGHYMATEIASRDLVDENRYDALDRVGEALGLARADPLWKDTALTELNRAVLHSFRGSGVTIVDHHVGSEQFIQFAQHERVCGRLPSANWTWITPPQAGAACPTFHLPMEDLADVPNYYRSRATDGVRLRVNHATEATSRARHRWRRLVRGVRAYLRRRA